MVRALASALLLLAGCANSARAPEVAPDPPGRAPVTAAQPGPAPRAPGPPPEPFEGEEERFGYRTSSGKVEIPPQYTIAMPFVDQVAAVLGDEGWRFIDRTGKSLAEPFLFDNGADDFVEGRARIVKGALYGFIASTGEIVVPPTWSFVEQYSGGYAAVCEGCVKQADGEHFTMTGGRWGYVDRAGKLVIPPRFDVAGPFVGSRATVTQSGRELVIGPDGAEAQ